jgi:prepilin-type N-terminal cleavage/methylation domain-containing protein
MNMILKKQMADRGIHGGTLKLPSFGGVPRSGGVVIGRRKGFTLVEVIVVLVILAILAAIAIPALTGYIDKAEDKKWISWARNAAVAYRATLSEAYAEGTLTDEQLEGLKEGNVTSSAVKIFFGSLGASFNHHIEMNKFIGWEKGTTTTILSGISVIGPNDIETTALNADGFFIYSQEMTKKQATFVTYKVKRDDGFNYDGIFNDTPPNYQKTHFVYDSTAGFEVYHVSG